MKCVTYTNSGHIDLCENMLKSFELVNNKNKFIVYCMDNVSYDYFNGLGYTVKKTDHADCKEGNHDWGSKEFRTLIQNKFPIIKNELDDKVLFVDNDIFFYKDPIPYLENILEHCDVVSQSDLPGTPFCTGFFAVNPSEKIEEVIDKITDYNPQTDGDYDDQLRFIKYIIETKTPIYVLDRYEFPNGHIGFIEKSSSDNKYIIHTNYMIGHDVKVDAMKKIGAWIL